MEIPKKLKEALLSGNFTVYYHDNGCATVYEGSFTHSQLTKGQEEDNLVVLFESEPDGYGTTLENLLIEALRGKLYSV